MSIAKGRKYLELDELEKACQEWAETWDPTDGKFEVEKVHASLWKAGLVDDLPKYVRFGSTREKAVKAFAQAAGIIRA